MVQFVETQDLDVLMIKRCPIIPINKHAQYYNRTDAEILEK